MPDYESVFATNNDDDRIIRDGKESYYDEKLEDDYSDDDYDNRNWEAKRRRHY